MTVIFAPIEELKLRLTMTNEAIEWSVENNRTVDPKVLQSKADLEESLAKLTGSNVVQSNQVDDGVGPGGRKAGSRAANQYGSNFTVDHATDRQVAFLKRLLAEKDLTGLKGVPTEIDGISKSRCSSWIDKLIDRADKPLAGKTPAPSDKATEKQLVWVRRLLAEKDLSTTVFHDREWTEWDIEKMTKRQAGAALDILFSLQDKPKSIDTDLESGIYLLDGKIVKAYMNRSETCLLSASLNMSRVEAGETTELWDYMGAASRFLKPEMKMDRDAQAAWGLQFGICCRCGRLLTDPNSIDRGMGEWCYSQAA